MLVEVDDIAAIFKDEFGEGGDDPGLVGADREQDGVRVLTHGGQFNISR
jgi:hypothetical protein